MERKDFSVQSEFDGLPLHVAVMLPDSEIRGVVQISHGMAEFKERYFEFMEYVTAAGFVTAVHDHRGHGESVKDKADLGYFYDTTGSAIVDDVHQITLELKRRYPQKPFVLFGHSMGSLVARSYLKKYDADIDKLVICGAPGKNPFAGVALALSGLLTALKGSRHRSALLQNLAFGSYNGKVGEKGPENAWICADPAVVDAYNASELCGFTFTLNGFRNLFLLMKTVYSPCGWELRNAPLPILFIAGRNDPVILGERAWLRAQDFLRRVGYGNVRGILYDGMRHEILNEKDRKTVFADVLSWISE
ncbi:alpha/beta fold hydrolase [Treponema brennaborense]|uniref:Alpha/beta hydrolase fold protein n=1 Tax=Treponema brennaborense (strain DSM 12168 / CIP 105900 / DD5/3) TaxID=906968 RepID=F4LLT8_TREBD|nr:alpha/beta hydrolase [Treponema brennaborense]AEE17732.1 alpha/beta hydrolase fold protein [Treponema brennaborense DSM 12168]